MPEGFLWYSVTYKGVRSQRGEKRRKVGGELSLFCSENHFRVSTTR